MSFDIDEELEISNQVKSSAELALLAFNRKLTFEQAIIVVRKRFDLSLNEAYLALITNNIWAKYVIKRCGSDRSFKKNITNYVRSQKSDGFIQIVDDDLIYISSR